MTTDNEELVQEQESESTPKHMSETRDLHALLGLGTYQGMSDAEIDLVIDYKVGVKVRSAVVLAEIDAAATAQEVMIDNNRATCDKVQSLLESILAREPVLASTDGSLTNG